MLFSLKSGFGPFLLAQIIFPATHHHPRPETQGPPPAAQDPWTTVHVTGLMDNSNVAMNAAIILDTKNPRQN